MRNISLSDFESCHLDTLDDCEAFCRNQEYLYVFSKGKLIKSDSLVVEVILDITENLYPVTCETDIPKALDVSFCCEKESLYIILCNGDIISFQTNEVADENIVESFVDGLKAARWSPNEELIAVVTGLDTVLVLTQDFDPISEVELHGGGFGESQFITVGWGKKETQFRGSEGKFKAGNQNQDDVQSSNGSNESNSRVLISWRGDAEYFAVSCINPATSRRYLRIFSKNGVLQYTSEDLPGLEHNLSWSSSGSLIASTQILPNKYVVCFFEKNGLKHGEIRLPLLANEIKVHELLWNQDSKILSLLISKVNDESSKYIQLFTVSNYNWYCKYTINFDTSVVPISMQWDKYKTNTLHVITKNENLIFHNKYSWLWTTNKSKVSTLNDESMVAVIDGCNLKLTSFSRGIIPPPMCTYSISTPDYINSVSFAPDYESSFANDLIIQLCSGNILMYKFINKGPRDIEYKFVGKINKFSENFDSYFNACWVGTNSIMLCYAKYDLKKSKPFLSFLNFNASEGGDLNLKRKDISLSSTYSLLKASKSTVVFYTNDLKLYSFDKSTQELTLLCNCNKNVIDLDVKDKGNGNFDFFALDVLNRFLVNNNVILNNILSFHLHENFILLTTMKHELLCLNSDMDITKISLSEICNRRVERGSRIVTSLNSDSKVILQMPRGNLECVQPRALSLHVLSKYLNSLQYFKAYDLMRKQRINLNLLYDHNPQLFSENVTIFIQQIKDLQWVSLFLSELSDENVTQTMYSVFYQNKNNELKESNGKIDKVCALIEKALTDQENSDKFILPILMSYIKRGKTEFIEKALLKLKELRDKEQRGMNSVVSFDEAFKYVLYIIDVEELYKVALGMYDFDLVLVIASKSQKDPKEYLEFLNELNQLESNYQKYRIDKYLKRYNKALTHLVKCEGDDIFNESINFIKTHKLYSQALKLIPENTDQYKNICLCFADDLLKNHSYEEAGFMYLNAGSFQNAMEAYRKAGNWQEVLYCSRELKLEENELLDLYLDLAMELFESKLFKESSIIYLDYLKDTEECIRTLSKGKLFAEAYRIAHLHLCTHLIDKIIVPEIIEQGNLMQMHVATLKETFIKQKDRLQVVRKQKTEVADDKNEFDDLYSETNTVITQSNASSRTSNRTYRSAKNRRKQERKLLSLKEGSPYEDLALITSLHNIVTNSIALKTEVRELNKFLLKIKKNDIAEILQKLMEDFLKVIEISKSEIWTPDLLNNRQTYGPDSTSNEISAMYMRSEGVIPVSLNPKYCMPPETQNNFKWQFEMLN